MENMIYLLNMSVSGIKNISKEVRLEFYKKTVDKTFNPEKYRVKAIYGENGSGKTAIITAVKIFRDLINNNNYLNESKTQIFLEEVINKSTRKFCFACEFLVVSETSTMVVYSYCVEIVRNEKGLYEIQSEVLKSKKGNYANKNYNLIFENRNGELRYVASSEEQRKVLEIKSINFLTSHSFVYIYTTSQERGMDVSKAEKVDQELSTHIMMCMLLTMRIKVYLAEEDQHENFLRNRLGENQWAYLAQKKIIYAYFMQLYGLASVNERVVDKNYYAGYREKIEQLTQFIKIFKPELLTIDIETKENGKQYECELILNYGDYRINKEFESTGIKKLIRLFDCFAAASTVGIVFVDEMDSNLNDVYLCKLIEYFMYYGKGQLCFTTHNLDPMTVLKENRNSIDFLSSDNHLVSWTSRGNASPENCYKNGMIEDSPFNIDATDFIGIFGE